MNRMRTPSFLLLTYCLTSCSGGIEDRHYSDPITGKRYPSKTIEVDGWKIATVGNTIVLSKGDRAILAVSDAERERTIMVMTPLDPLNGAANLIDEGFDQVYESINYGNGERSITDISLDGTVDSVLDYEGKELMIRYGASLYPFVEERENRHIFVDGIQVPVLSKYGTFVPVEK